jgi:hypothetical protein
MIAELISMAKVDFINTILGSRVYFYGIYPGSPKAVALIKNSINIRLDRPKSRPVGIYARSGIITPARNWAAVAHRGPGLNQHNAIGIRSANGSSVVECTYIFRLLRTGKSDQHMVGAIYGDRPRIVPIWRGTAVVKNRRNPSLLRFVVGRNPTWPIVRILLLLFVTPDEPFLKSYSQLTTITMMPGDRP